jgi:molybdopterin molybdotransferase
MALLSCSDALALVAEKIRDLAVSADVEQIPLPQALGRILAQTVAADRDQPPFPRSTRDGYAVRAEDAGRRELLLIGGIRAGEAWTGSELGEGEAIEIMTGAPVPEGADAVVMLEHVSLEASVLKLAAGRSLLPGENIVPRAAEAKDGDTLLHGGVRMGAAEIALCASVGASAISVYAKPTVAILATGDELVAMDETPGPMQIRNSNSHGLAALVESNGGLARVLPPAADTREALHAAITATRDAEMLILSGGVSAGKYDFVEDVLLSLGAEFFFTGVAIQPGKPAVFGRIPADDTHREQWIFGLPGNPVSTQVTATLFVMPMLRALAGEGVGIDGVRGIPGPVFVYAQLTETIQVRPGLTRFLPAHMASFLTGSTVTPTGWQGSGDLHSNARANCYLVVPATVDHISVGNAAVVLLR